MVTIGSGGMGLVLRAYDALLEREVAIKLPLMDPRTHPEVRRRFLREAQALAGLSHPAIVRVYDVREIEPVYYTMELVNGRTLQELMVERGRFEVSEALRLLSPIAAALSACHGGGLVHRDVKPTAEALRLPRRTLQDRLMRQGIRLRERRPQ